MFEFYALKVYEGDISCLKMEWDGRDSEHGLLPYWASGLLGINAIKSQ